VILRKHFLAPFFVLASLFTVVVRAEPTSFDRPRVYDVQHYTIRLSFDRAKKIVFGDTTVDLTPLSSLTQIELDSIGMTFTSIKFASGGTELPYKTASDKVMVTLGRAFAPGDKISLRLKYTITAPKRGVYFIAAASGAEKARHPAQIWSHNEPEDARYWFPSFDFPSDKATSEEFITAPKGEIAVGNGAFVEKKPEANGAATFHYRMEVPHSTYLTSFVVGNFIKLEDKYRDLPLGFYTYDGRQPVAKIAFSRTGEMMKIFEELTGVGFPFAKYDQIMVSGFQEFDGMENVTATTLADTEVMFAEYPFARTLVEDLVSHELSHSWFGDMVTCRNWSELWLNEGFATFMEAAFREKVYGRENYISKLGQDRDAFIADDTAGSKRRHALRNELAKPDNSVFDITTYQKGGLVVHMLRETVGDAAFWKGITLYLNKYKYGNAVSSDLEAAMEEASGKDLKWFFDEWVYSAGYPKLDVRQQYDPAAGQLKITVDQIQNIDQITPAAYRFPLDIEIQTPSGAVTQTLDITKRSETFTVAVPAEPTKLVVDKAEKVILKLVRMR